MTDTDDTDTIAIETIPIERIVVLNPRVRNARKFAEIVDSIRKVVSGASAPPTTYIRSAVC